LIVEAVHFGLAGEGVCFWQRGFVVFQFFRAVEGFLRRGGGGVEEDAVQGAVQDCVAVEEAD
jgi:hypothetical protein